MPLEVSFPPQSTFSLPSRPDLGAASFSAQPIRIAVICDLVEENWPSMDLVGDMLLGALCSEHTALSARQIQPRLPSVTRSMPHTVTRLLGRFLQYPRELRRLQSNFDVFHIVDHSYAHLVHSLPSERCVVTCHDLDTFRCLLDPLSKRRSPLFRAMTRRILTGLQAAAHVTCDTTATRDGIITHKLVPESRLTVVHNGVHPALSPRPDAASDEELSRLLGRKPGEVAEVLHVGSTIPRKRIDVLLNVFAAARKHRPGLRLLRVGGPFTGQQQFLARSLSVCDAIDVLPRLSPPLLASVYRRASVLLQPSESEGFGLPVIEAMACGTPVIASDIPALHEVGGDAATFCAVGNITEWTSSVVHQVDQPRNKAKLLSHAEKFCWSKYASQMAAIYRQVLAG